MRLSSSMPRGMLRREHPGPNRAPSRRRSIMCRNIKTLYNFDPPATDTEVRAASLIC